MARSRHAAVAITCALACLNFLCFTADAFAGYAAVGWQDASKPPLKSETVFSCGPPRMIDIRISYSLNPTFVIGDPDPSCPWGFGPNPYRFSFELFRDSALLGSHTFQSAGCWTRDWHVNIPAEPGNYYAKIKLERRLGPWIWSTVDSMQSPALVAVKSKATPNFTINNMVIPPAGAPLTVKIANPIVMNGSSTTCATKYLVGVEESDAWWNRTYRYEWTRWFSGKPPSNINLQVLSTTYSVAPDWLGNDPSRQGTPLFGGLLDNGQPRFYRVALCTGEPAWDCKHTLLKVE
jgi:hypothetical protein